MTIRETVTYFVSDLGGGQEFLYPEKIKLQLDPRERVSPIDIGAFAYSVRELRGAEGIAVDENSFIVQRREFIKAFLDSIYTSGSTDKTILSVIRDLKDVLDWCDANGHLEVFLGPRPTRIAYIGFCDDLKNKLLVKHTLKPLTCASRQRAFANFVSLALPSDAQYILRGVPPFKAVRQPRTPPREEAVRYYVQACMHITTIITPFLLKGGAYPLLAENNGFKVSIFPMQDAIQTIYSGERRYYTLSRDGTRIATFEEIQAAYPHQSNSAITKAIQSANLCVERANADLRHEHRLLLASLAMAAYACLFNLITGAGASELTKFEYSNGTEIVDSVVKKELVSVKFRARGKTTLYPVGRIGVALLKEYLKLREWVLNGDSSPYLFLNMERKGRYSGACTQLPLSFSTMFFARISGVFLPTSEKNLPVSSVRKFKSLVLHELKFSPVVVSDVMNHTPMMNNKSYSETTIEKHEKEFDSYWQSVRKAGEMVRDQKNLSVRSTVVGHCGLPETPTRISTTVAIEPNCRTQHGCLYCENYLCHADEEDVHKLLSLEYVVTALRDVSGDLNHSERLFKDLVMRIKIILDSVGARSLEHSAMVKSQRTRVHDLGILTPFWENKLLRYEKMGYIF